MPKGHAWDERNEGEYATERHTCQGCAARERDESDRERRNGEYVTVHRLPPQPQP